MEKEGEIIKWRVGEEESQETEVSVTAATGRRGQELQQVLQKGNPASGSAAALLQPNSSLFPKQKQAAGLQPASCLQQSAAHDNSLFCL